MVKHRPNRLCMHAWHNAASASDPTGSGSLAPLFYAFGLISEQQLQEDQAINGGGAIDVNFLVFLREQVNEAVKTAERHDALKISIRKLRAGLEERYSLSAVQASGKRL